MKAIIFDLDGTLFQTEKVGVPAFRNTFEELRRLGRYDGPVPSDERIASVFGMTHQEIWETLLPGADPETRRFADRRMLDLEVDMLRSGEGVLYPGVEETLRRLDAAGHPLFIASNGAENYVRAALDSKGLTPLFAGIWTAGKHKTETKTELVRMLMDECGVSGGIMVGDRKSDVEAGKGNGLFVVGCRYEGFPAFGGENELEGSDRIIRTFRQLEDVVAEFPDR
ncbi:HAD family hydrolase [Staphylospora marina]|uniref:HAD family hydrolase n=1 Tax=Staphylospora marina TaxID=2490858 RepID=UPI001F14D7FF|nr:HAD family hydrolase [Staphylospora marina]